MPLTFSTSSLQSGRVTASTISFPSSAVREFLEQNPASELPAFFFLHIYAVYIVRSMVSYTMHVCCDDFSQCTWKCLVIKLLIFIIMNI